MQPTPLIGMDSQTLVTQIRDLGLWPEQEAVQRQLSALQQRLPDGKLLARELLQLGVLTPYQANQILTGKSTALTIGPYVILERLGEGGMGQVFKARQKTYRRPVALKVIRQDKVANANAIERFVREAKVVASLAHPNVVGAYDADRCGDTYYYAMEYLEGEDLGKMVQRLGKLPLAQACNYLTQAAQGLQHIHQNGLVHRDIKPGNLMVTRAGEPGAPWGVLKILDLGIARLSEEAKSEQNLKTLTQLGVIIGTADYMAPEQALQSRDVDIRSDIYSLGCTFFYALTGRPPFEGENPVEKMLKHQIEAPPPLETLRPETPPALRAVLARMLAKKREARYAEPREVAAALAQALSTAGAPEPPPPLATAPTPEPPPAFTEPSFLPEHTTENAAVDTSVFSFGSEEAQPSSLAHEVQRRARQHDWGLYAFFGGVAVAGAVVLVIVIYLMARLLR